MRIPALLMTCAVLSGCATDPDTKIASNRAAVALASLGEAEHSFTRLYLQEIDNTRELVKRTMVARAVVDKVNDLAGELEDKGDLLNLSLQIESTEEAIRGLSEEVENLGVADQQSLAKQALSVETMAGRDGRQDTAQEVRTRLEHFLDQKRQNMMKTAELFPKGHPTRRELEAKAGAAELIGQSSLDQLFVLMQLQAMRAEAQAGLRDLRGHIARLQAVHATIDQWIQMDVKPSGAEIATLMEKHLKPPGGADAR